jgi:hypothetical protein
MPDGRHPRSRAGETMNRFEPAVYGCMIPTATLLEETSKPLHRAMLLNFWRHVHLEGAGEYEQIVAPDMMVNEPFYRVTWGANPAVIKGKDGVLAFYHSVGESVLWHSDDRLEAARLSSGPTTARRASWVSTSTKTRQAW